MRVSSNELFSKIASRGGGPALKNLLLSLCGWPLQKFFPSPPTHSHYSCLFCIHSHYSCLTLAFNKLSGVLDRLTRNWLTHADRLCLPNTQTTSLRTLAQTRACPTLWRWPQLSASNMTIQSSGDSWDSTLSAAAMALNSLTHGLPKEVHMTKHCPILLSHLTRHSTPLPTSITASWEDHIKACFM